jgi:hypothetical protein
METKKLLQMLRSFIKTVVTGLAFLAFSTDASAQKSNFSFRIGRDISGNGLGGNICPSIALTKNKSTYSIGPNFQRRKMNLTGAQANYSYSVATNYNQKLELYFSGSFTFQTSAYMSKENIELEKSCHKEGPTDYDNLRFNVIEGYGGIGLRFNPAKTFSVGFTSGLGVFDTLNKNYDREMYRGKSGFVLRLRVVLIYNFKTRD